jgi:hypothetical protein
MRQTVVALLLRAMGPLLPMVWERIYRHSLFLVLRGVQLYRMRKAHHQAWGWARPLSPPAPGLVRGLASRQLAAFG